MPRNTMNNRRNVEIIQEAYAAFSRGDIDAIINIEADDTELEIAGPNEIPWAGSYRGHAGARRYLSAILAEADFDAFEPRAFVGDGDQVIVLGFEKVRAKRTGRAYANHWVHAFTLARGKITHFREYCDTATVAAAFRAT